VIRAHGLEWRARGAYQPPFETDEEIDAKQDAVCEIYFAIVRTPAPQTDTWHRSCASRSRNRTARALGRSSLRSEMLASTLRDLEREGFEVFWRDRAERLEEQLQALGGQPRAA